MSSITTNKKNEKEIQKKGKNRKDFKKTSKIKKPCQKSLDRDKTKNKHYEQTLSLIKIVSNKKQ